MALHYVSGHPDTDSDINRKVLTILVHGGALSSRMYRTFTPHLTSPWIAIDLPGHGKSVQLGPFTFDRSTALLAALIEDLQTKPEYNSHKIALVGISLGGQAVLDVVMKHPSLIHTALISGVSIQPPGNGVVWEMPHMPTDQAWLDVMMEDVAIMGMEAATALQSESFAFEVDPRRPHDRYPPVLVCVGEHDTAMATRDFPDLVAYAKTLNTASEGRVLDGGFHNHSIDVPEQFSKVVNAWIGKMT